MYIYAKRPVGELVARARLGEVRFVDASTAVKRAMDIGMPSCDVRQYVRDKGVCLYELRDIQMAITNVPLEWMREHCSIHPPVHHLFLSARVQQALDDRAGFVATPG